jgi:hypothetical protein
MPILFGARGDNMPSQKSSNLQSHTIDALIAVTIAVLFTVFLIALPLSVTFVLMLLVGTWWLDAFLKKAMKYHNTTAFADLSFAALIFSGSQGISLMRDRGINSIASEDIATRIIILTAILGFVWLGNLSLCRSLEKIIPRNDERLMWVISFVLAFFSVCAALYVHELKA